MVNFDSLEKYSMQSSSNIDEQTQKRELEELQKQAYEELAVALLDCNSTDGVVIEVAAWKDKYNITDIDTFFSTNNELAADVYRLIRSKLDEVDEEKRKKENEKALQDMINQKKAFLRIYTICSEARNEKDFETAKSHLDDWLKMHPKNSWDNFGEGYKKFFEKYANEEYLKTVTNYGTQEEVMDSLREIVDYATRYSNYSFFQQNIEKWHEMYREDVFSRANRDEVEKLLKEGYEKLTPPEIPQSEIDEFDSLKRCFSFAIII